MDIEVNGVVPQEEREECIEYTIKKYWDKNITSISLTSYSRNVIYITAHFDDNTFGRITTSIDDIRNIRARKNNLNIMLGKVLAKKYNIEINDYENTDEINNVLLKIISEHELSPVDVLNETYDIIERYTESMSRKIDDILLDFQAHNDLDKTFLAVPIENLELSARSRNWLIRHQYFYVFDLVNASWDDVNRIRNLGKKSIIEIRDLLLKADVDFLWKEQAMLLE